MGWLVTAAAAGVAASVALVVWLPERPTTPVVPSTSGPPASQLPFAVGASPRLPVVAGSELIWPRAGGQPQSRLSYQDGEKLELFQSDAGVVVFDRSGRGVYVVEATAERELVSGAPLGVAVDATRMAYAV